MGNSGGPVPLEVEPPRDQPGEARGENVQGTDRSHGRQGSRASQSRSGQEPLAAGDDHPRSRRGDHRQRSEKIGLQRSSADVGREEPVPVRWGAVCLECGQEPDADDHGTGLARVRLSGRSGQERQPVNHTNDQDANGFSKPTRRQTMQWVMAAVAASSLPKRKGFGAAPVEKKVGEQEAGGKQPPRLASEGYGVDPKLTTPHSPGDFWPLILTDTQKRNTKALADVILPKDDLGPAASELGVPEMID